MAAVILKTCQASDALLLGVSAFTRQLIAAYEARADMIFVIGRPANDVWKQLILRQGYNPHLTQFVDDIHAIAPEPDSRWLMLHEDGLVTAEALRLALASLADEQLMADGKIVAAVAGSPAAALLLLKDDHGGYHKTVRRLAADQYIALNNRAAAEWQIVVRTCKESDGWVARYLNRRLSNQISMPAARLGLDPMTFTLITAVVALSMFLMLIYGSPITLIAGCLLFQAASILDGVDGEIARATYKSSKIGANLDTGIDMMTNIAFVAGLTIGLAKTEGIQYATFGMALAAAMLFCVLTMTLLLYLGPKGGSFDVLGRALAENFAAKPPLQRGMVWVEHFFKRDFFALFFALLALAGHVTAIPWFLAFGVAGWFAAIVYCAPLILNDREGRLLPKHLRGNG